MIRSGSSASRSAREVGVELGRRARRAASRRPPAAARSAAARRASAASPRSSVKNSTAPSASNREMWARAAPPRPAQLGDDRVVDGAQRRRASPSPGASGAGRASARRRGAGATTARRARWSVGAPPSAITALVIRSRSHAARSVGPGGRRRTAAPGRPGSASPSKCARPRRRRRCARPTARASSRSARYTADDRGVDRRQQVRGDEARLGPQVDAQHRRRDEADRALAAAQRAREVGAGRAARRDPRVHRAAVGEHRRDADHRVLEEAVPRARLARRAHRDDAAERRRQHRPAGSRRSTGRAAPGCARDRAR